MPERRLVRIALVVAGVVRVALIPRFDPHTAFASPGLDDELDGQGDLDAGQAPELGGLALVPCEAGVVGPREHDDPVVGRAAERRQRGLQSRMSREDDLDVEVRAGEELEGVAGEDDHSRAHPPLDRARDLGRCRRRSRRR